MLKLASALLLGWGIIGLAQEKPKKAQPQAPPMRVNILNVCAPNEAEQKEIAAALGRVPQRPSFGRDYEVTRGHTTMEDGSGSEWVRIMLARRRRCQCSRLKRYASSSNASPKSS